MSASSAASCAGVIDDDFLERGATCDYNPVTQPSPVAARIPGTTWMSRTHRFLIALLLLAQPNAVQGEPWPVPGVQQVHHLSHHLVKRKVRKTVRRVKMSREVRSCHGPGGAGQAVQTIAARNSTRIRNKYQQVELDRYFCLAVDHQRLSEERCVGDGRLLSMLRCRQQRVRTQPLATTMSKQKFRRYCWLPMIAGPLEAAAAGFLHLADCPATLPPQAKGYLSCSKRSAAP